MGKRKKVKELKKYTGILTDFFETGCEGVMWALLKDGKDKEGHKSLEFIEAGDYLTIYDTDGSIIFKGKIIPDRKIGWQEYPKNPGHGKPSALGYWIHWTQKGWQPDDWASLFIRGKKLPLRAELVRKILEDYPHHN